MPPPDASLEELWRSRWRPSSSALRYYGRLIDRAVADLPAVLNASTAELEQARENLRAFVDWLDGMIVRRDWARRKSLRLGGELGLLTLGVVSVLGGPITLLGAVALGGSVSLFLVDVADLGFKATTQDRIRDLIGKIDVLEQAIRAELASRP